MLIGCANWYLMINAVLHQPGFTAADDENASSPFELLQRYTSDNYARYVLKQKPEWFAGRDSAGYLLIHRACIRGDALIVSALLHIGCDPTALTQTGLTGVHLAAMFGHVVVLSLLGEAGANLEQTDFQGKTPLHYAAANDQVVVVSWLLQITGVSWTAVVDESGRTPLHLASEGGHERTVRFLLSNIPHSCDFRVENLMARDRFGNTYVHSALAPLQGPVYSCDSEAITNRASKVLWILLTHSYRHAEHESKEQFQPLLYAVSTQNNARETPLDLANKYRVGSHLRRLLFLAFILTKKFPSRLSCSLFILIYRLVWLEHLLLPISIVVLSFALATWTQSGWFYILGALLTLGSSVKQRHRLKDATERPNPYFLGAFSTGFAVSAHCLWYDLAIPTPNLSVNYPVLVLILFGPLFCFLLCTLVFWQHPLASSGLFHRKTLVHLASIDLSHVREHLLRLHSETDPSTTLAQIPYNELYCAQCDLNLGQFHPIPIKHCRLCNRCRVGLDHHCLFLMNCVTRANLRYFVLLLLCSVGFMCSFCLLAVLIPLEVCSSAESQTQLLCICERFPRPVILLPFHIVAGLWVITLLSESCHQLSLLSVPVKPRRTRRSFFGRLHIIFQALRILIRGSPSYCSDTSMLFNS